MAYLNNIYSADPNKAFVYKISDDKVENRVSTGTKPNGICVSTDQTTVLVTNMDDNTVSIFRNGSKVRDWPVGTQPWGVCQGIAHDNDPGTPYYVSNYTDNTVTKFFISSTGVVTEGKTYSVGKGPRGLCSDPTGNIYVANYNSSTVSVIGYVTDLVGGEIEVASSPQQICSTTNGDIYVACSTSGVVTKIVSNNKTTDITVGRKPMGICVDKNNAIWVTNYKSNTICKIINDEIALTTTITGYPAFIDCDNNNNLWVYSHETKKLIKLNKTGVIIEEIETDYNPSAYGDFTGMQASMIVGNVSDYNGDGSKKISWDDLDSTLQNIINHLTVPTNIKATNVDYENHSTYTNVQEALDALLYEKPAIESFVCDPVIVEVGTKLEKVKFDWSLSESGNTNVDKQVIRNGTLTLKTVDGDQRSVTHYYADDPLEVSTEFQLDVYDKSGAVVTKSCDIKFLPKIYWGTSELKNITTDEDVLALQNNDFIDVKAGEAYDETFHFNATGAKYLYFVVPSSLTINKDDFLIGGFYNDNWTETSLNFTNETGALRTYKVFKLNDQQHSDDIAVRILYGGSADHT